VENSLPFKGRVGMGYRYEPTPILAFPLKGKEFVAKAFLKGKEFVAKAFLKGKFCRSSFNPTCRAEARPTS
jgi:hypothetical protein